MLNNTPTVLRSHSDDCTQFIRFKNLETDAELTLVQVGLDNAVLQKHANPILRDHYLLHFVKSGSGSLILPHATYEINADECFLIYPQEGNLYRPHSQNGWYYYWIGIRGSKVEDYLSLIGFQHDKQVLHFNNPEIYAILEEILQSAFLYQNDLAALQLHTDTLLRKLLFSLYTEAQNNQTRMIPYMECDNIEMLGFDTSADKYVNTIITMIQTSYAENIRVDEIADNLHLNRNYLSTLFKKETGKSIKQYLIYYRIHTAKKFLANTDLSITDISYRVGFQDPLYFSRLFKSQLGISPSEYRQNA